ncbi:tissue factor pathway inhibitor a [Syngnathus scovelli]|uniref:tissue factor pathway inhibitor a n=1 Tax=Syngnathus scovelli TaxID=161590 RepID=UPI0021103C67|nr:tissue factor pathway inhibitor a isoform X1 [Syngnathus scovelli]
MLPCNDDNRWRRRWLLCVCLLATCSATAQEAGAATELFIFDELCAMKADAGPCRSLNNNYFFNVDTGHCELFEYGGCGGNANNFETLEACQETCLVSEDKNPCHLPEAEGPCRGLVTRFFFDSSSQRCKRFYYGGCFGNANNFRSIGECRARCQKQETVTVQNGARETISVRPTLTGEQTAIMNQNGVQTNNTGPDHSQDATLPDATLPDACSGPAERGTCDGSVRRFAYHAESKRCHEFLYSGCGGNSNNFKHRRQCIRKCIKSQKGGGEKMIRIRKKNIPNILRGSV